MNKGFVKYKKRLGYSYYPSLKLFITNMSLPTGKSDEEFIKVARVIEEKVKNLALRIQNGEV